MEHHPIPQDITGFQFKLIGEMTVKQFAYLAAGGILAVLSFYAPLFFIIKLPLAFLCAGFGAALAFLPVEGRPLDTMLSYYFRALMSPTQYVYQKTGRSLPKQQATALVTKPATSPYVQAQPTSQATKQPLADFLATVHEQNRQAGMQTKVLTHTTPSTVAPSQPSGNVVIQTPVTHQPSYVDVPSQYQGAQIISMHGKDEQKQVRPLPSIDEQEEPTKKPAAADETEKKEDTIEKEELKLQKELAQAKLIEQQQQTAETSKAAHSHTLALEEQLHEIADQKSSLEQEIMNLKKQLAAQGQQVMTAGSASTEPPQAPRQVSQQVKQVTNPQARAAGLPQVNDPNIIAGVVKDSRGNLLPNILVEILDQQNNPVRAFKTTQLGQFLSATKIPNGTYKMTFEDPKGQHTFEVIEIVAKGDLLLPLEIVSQDAREALRRELFS